MKTPKPLSRRGFLRRATAVSAAAAFPAIIPDSALGADGRPAPSNRVAMGFIGVGNQGTGDMRGFLGDKRVQVLAVCDPNREGPGYWSGRVAGREPARRIVNQRYGNQDCAAYEDFRELLARDDIDAVEVATPDHWHSGLTIAAARAGKDIYCQKPFSLTVVEGRAMVEAIKRHGRVLQVGSQQRSDMNFRRACELVRNGRIGQLQTVRCGLPGGTPDYGKTGDRKRPEPVPDGFNYDLWLGPAPWAPYCPARVGVNFRWIYDYSGGQLTDWGGHHPDIAQWGMDTENTGPVEIRNARAVYPENDPLWNTATEYYFECLYKNGVKLIVSNRERGGVTFQGSEGWVWANRGSHDASSEAIKTSPISPDEIHLYESRNHFRNFIDCVLSRAEPIAPAETGHRSITIAHLGNIAMTLGRDLRWNPEAERFINDPGADSMLGRAWRQPWVL